MLDVSATHGESDHTRDMYFYHIRYTFAVEGSREYIVGSQDLSAEIVGRYSVHGSMNQSRTDLVELLPAEAFEPGGIEYDHVHRPLGEEELMQPVVGDLENGRRTTIGNGFG